MAKISIDPAKTKPCVTRMDDVARNLKELSGTLDDIRGNLGYKIAGREQIAARLRDVSGQVVREETAVRSMRDGLEQIVSQYQRTESLNLGQVVAEAIAQASATTSPSGGGTVQSGEDLLKASEEEMNRFISEFEKTHPDEAKKFNKFLKSGKNNQINDDDVRAIKYLAYNAKEPFRSIYLKSLSKFKIGDADMNDGAFYKPFFHTLNYTYDNDEGKPNNHDCFRNDPRGAYTTLFHECGHAIDDLSDQSKWWGSDTEKFTARSDAMGRDVTLREAIEYDVYHNANNPHSMTAVAERIRQSGTPGDVNNVIHAFQSHQDPSTLSDDDHLLYQAVRDEFQLGLQNRGTQTSKYESVTDVYGAMTHNEIRVLVDENGDPYLDKNGDPYLKGFGHDTNYWSDNTKVAKELWAEYFSYNMAGNTENLDALLEYFPEAAKIMEQYANALGG